MGRVTTRELYGECFLYYYIIATDTRSFLVTFSLQVCEGQVVFTLHHLI